MMIRATPEMDMALSILDPETWLNSLDKEYNGLVPFITYSDKLLPAVSYDGVDYVILDGNFFWVYDTRTKELEPLDILHSADLHEQTQGGLTQEWHKKRMSNTLEMRQTMYISVDKIVLHNSLRYYVYKDGKENYATIEYQE